MHIHVKRIYIYLNIHTYMYKYTNMYIHICTYIYICMQEMSNVILLQDTGHVTHVIQIPKTEL